EVERLVAVKGYLLVGARPCVVERHHAPGLRSSGNDRDLETVDECVRGLTPRVVPELGVPDLQRRLFLRQALSLGSDGLDLDGVATEERAACKRAVVGPRRVVARVPEGPQRAPDVLPSDHLLKLG